MLNQIFYLESHKELYSPHGSVTCSLFKLNQDLTALSITATSSDFYFHIRPEVSQLFVKNQNSKLPVQIVNQINHLKSI